MSDGIARSTSLRAIPVAWLVVGILDISSALIVWWTRNMTPARGLQGIAAGLLGPKSTQGGIATAMLGLAIHFFIALAVVTIFYLASQKIPLLIQHPVICGLLYGIAVYLVMYWIVLPMTFPTFHHRLGNDLPAIAIHIALIGLPTALIVGKFSQTSAASVPR
jgi:hypothetical protein